MGLEIGLLTQEGSWQRGAARSNQGRKARPTVTASQGPEDELTAQRKSNLCPAGGNPCVGMLDSSEHDVRITACCDNLFSLCLYVCVWRYRHTCAYMYIYTHSVWCFSSLYLNYIKTMF